MDYPVFLTRNILGSVPLNSYLYVDNQYFKFNLAQNELLENPFVQLALPLLKLRVKN